MLSKWQVLLIILKLVALGANGEFFVNGSTFKAYRRVSCEHWETAAEIGDWDDEELLLLKDEQRRLFHSVVLVEFFKRI